MAAKIYQPGECFQYPLSIKVGKPMPPAEIEVVDADDHIMPMTDNPAARGHALAMADPKLIQIELLEG